MARSILQQGMAALDASAGTVFALDEPAGALVVLEARGHPDGPDPSSARIPLEAPWPAAEAVRRGELVLVGSPDELRARFPAIAAQPAAGAAFAWVPMTAGGEVAGVIELSFGARRRLSETDVAFLRALGDLGGRALGWARAGAADRRARQRMAFLARASHVLSESLEADVTLQTLAQLAVPALADWCVVDVKDEAGARRSVAVAHTDPARVALAEDLLRRYPPRDSAASPAMRVLATGQSQYLRDIPEEQLASLARDEEHLRILRDLGLRSAMVVPITARDRVLGAISLISNERPFEPDDLEFAEELGRRVGLALDNARLHEQARATEARLRGILASAMDAIITIDESQRIVLFNAAAERLFGWSAGEVMGRSISLLIPERFRDAHVHHVRRFGETGVTNRAMGSLGTLWGLRADGAEFPIEATISKLQDRGQLLSTVILRDVTDRIAKEQQLAEAHRHKDHFLAMLGHELRNPLAAVRHAVELQQMADANESPDLAWSRSVIERQVGHMTRLIDDLLDVSRIARGKIELRKRPVDLAAVLRAVVADHARAAREAGIRLEASFPERPAWVDGDEARLVQIVQNLIDNALKFTDALGEVRVTLDHDGSDLVLEVGDTGIGIEPNDLEELFEPFRQADASLARTRGGLGLGLAVTRGMVSMHGGTVEAHSAGLWQGSTFVVRLPKGAPPVAGPRERAPGGALPFRRILVVEDNEDAAALLGSILRRQGAEAVVAHSGETGLEAARRERPDLVLCDIGLPGALDGYQVAEAIRADDAMARTTLVALTGYGLPEDVARAHAAGFDAHLTKPIEIRRLRRVLEDLAARRSSVP